MPAHVALHARALETPTRNVRTLAPHIPGTSEDPSGIPAAPSRASDPRPGGHGTPGDCSQERLSRNTNDHWIGSTRPDANQVFPVVAILVKNGDTESTQWSRK